MVTDGNDIIIYLTKDVSGVLCLRCDRAGVAGTIRLAAVRCPNSLAFDIERQTCNWKLDVNNCDRLSRE